MFKQAAGSVRLYFWPSNHLQKMIMHTFDNTRAYHAQVHSQDKNWPLDKMCKCVLFILAEICSPKQIFTKKKSIGFFYCSERENCLYQKQ